LKIRRYMPRIKLFVFISILLFSGYVITNIVSYQAAKESLRSSIINTSLPLTRDNIYSEIQRDLMRPIFISSLMANDTFLKDWAIDGEHDIERVKRYLLHIMEKYKFFASFFVSESTGNYYYYNGILKQISKDVPRDQWYYKFTAKPEPYEVTVDSNQAARNTMTIFINHRVQDYDHKLIGVTGVGLELDRIKNMLSEYRVRYDRDIYLVDTKGNIQVGARTGGITESNIKKAEGIAAIAPQILQVNYASGNFEYDYKGEHMLLTSRYIPELDWYLLVVQNQNVALKSIWHNFVKNTMIGFVLTVLILGVIISMLNYYQNRLECVTGTNLVSGSYNRSDFVRVFETKAHEARKNKGNLSVVIMDIDDFRGINDRFGHICADNVLERVSCVISAELAQDDIMTRWGGDEFIVLTACSAEEANHLAMRIQDRINNDKDILKLTEKETVSVSVGISVLAEDDNEASITYRAETALSDAKEIGSNTIRTL